MLACDFRRPQNPRFCLDPAQLALFAWLGCCGTAQAQPRLELNQPTPGTLEFHWAHTPVPFALEATTLLSDTALWQPVPGTPALAEGAYSLVVAAGTETRFFRLKSNPPRYTRIESFDPPHGATGVDLEPGTVVRFTGPLSSEGLDPEASPAVYAESGGVRLPVQFELSPDARSLNLTYRTNLPPFSRVRLVVDGNRLRDAESRRVDANNNDVPGGFRSAEFVTAGERAADLDGDGVPDEEEVVLGTDPNRRDTDGDGFHDGVEQRAGTNPTELASRPGLRLADGPGSIAERLGTFEADGPFASEATAITPEGLILDRIEAVLNLMVTPAMVNEAMDAEGVRIVTLRPGSPFVTLALPPRPEQPYTAAELEAIAGLLTPNSDLTPFLFVNLAFAPRATLAPGGPDSPASRLLAPLDLIRMPAAWNLLGAPAPASPVKIVVPDYYFDGSGHEQLPNQSFVFRASDSGNRGEFTTDSRGNHGYAVVSALASRFDESPPTGTLPKAEPAPEAYARIVSVPVGGLGSRDTLEVIGSVLRAEQPDILSTSLGYTAYAIAPPRALAGAGRLQRALGAIRWRFIVQQMGRPFLHVSAAGNDDDDPAALPAYDRQAEFDSEWNLAARRGSVEHLLQGADDVTNQDRFLLEQLVANTPLPAGAPSLTEPLDNVLIVGSVDATGTRSSFSEPGEDLLAPGEDLVLACTAALPGTTCNGSVATGRSGASYAAPHAAGLAAYLLTLKRDLTPAQLRELLMRTRNGDLPDAYRAVLELDAGNPQLRLRLRLLDVAGGEEEDASGALPDGVFDEQDVEAFLKAFRDAEAVRGAGALPDRSRFDLNGDGYTAGHTTARFDVDAANGLERVNYVLRGGPADLDELRSPIASCSAISPTRSSTAVPSPGGANCWAVSVNYPRCSRSSTPTPSPAGRGAP